LSGILLGIFPEESAKQEKDHSYDHQDYSRWTETGGESISRVDRKNSCSCRHEKLCNKGDIGLKLSKIFSKIDQRIEEITTALRDFKKN
jgi:hypothetical protein